MTILIDIIQRLSRRLIHPLSPPNLYKRQRICGYNAIGFTHAFNIEMIETNIESERIASLLMLKRTFLKETEDYFLNLFFFFRLEEKEQDFQQDEILFKQI